MSRRDIDYAEERIRATYWQLFDRIIPAALIFAMLIILGSIGLLGLLIYGIWSSTPH